MLPWIWQSLSSFIERGGPIMWPLLGLSIIGLALAFERTWFWIKTNNPWRTRKFQQVARYLRNGQSDHAAALVENDRSPYGLLVADLMANGSADADATQAVERQRPRLDRFMPTLGTIITAAPMLGILGTVVGIIQAFQVLSASEMVTDPARVGSGIAEALLTTVLGLLVALVILFPYNAFRAQVDRTLSRMEMLIAAAKHQNSQQSPDH